MLLKPRKNKSFSYTPRFSKDTDADTTQDKTSHDNGFSAKWRESRGLGAKQPKRGLPLSLLLLVLVVVLICMYLLDIKSK